MDFDLRLLWRQLAPMINILKEVKDDKNVTKAKQNETNVGETKVVRIVQIKQRRRKNKRRNEDWNKWKEESQRRNELKPTW